MPLSEIWPAQDVDAIEDTFSAAFAFAARAEIPPKPRTPYKVRAWAGKVKSLRMLVSRVVDGNQESGRALALNSPALSSRFMPKVDLLMQLDRAEWKRIGEVGEYPDGYRYGHGGTTISVPAVAVEIDGKRRYFDGAKSVADALGAVRAALEGPASEKKMEFEVRGRGSSWFINKKGDPLYRHLKEFTDSKEALAYHREHHDDLVSAWEAVKASDNVRKQDVRSAENRPRSAEDWRSGRDVTPDEFIGQFGFRGAQFGEWVAQGAGAKDRQGMLNQAYDALMDLASIIGVPPKAMSLNGSLGLAFGSRGSGWASAHYEPGQLVINLTKTRGAGSLAHEWFHALDNYFQRERGAKPGRENSYVTYNPENYYVSPRTGKRIPERKFNKTIEEDRAAGFGEGRGRIPDSSRWILQEGVRPEVGIAFSDLVKALNDSPMAKRAGLIDKGNGDGYWSRIIERAARSFENYVIHKMATKGYQNDYLANVVAVEEFARDKGRYPYLLENEIGPVADAFDNLFGTIQTKETDKGIALFSPSPGRVDADKVDVVVASRVVAGLFSGWRNAPDRRVVATRSDLPAVVLEELANQGEQTARGVFHGDTFYLVADEHASEAEVEETIFHEVWAHYGLRSMLGARTTGL